MPLANYSKTDDKQWIKSHYKIILTAIVLIIIVICIGFIIYTNYQDRQEENLSLLEIVSKEKENTSPQVKIPSGVSSQDGCLKEARAFYENGEWYRDRSIVSSYDYFYNRKYDACFILVELSWGDYNETSLSDVLSNEEYGVKLENSGEIVNCKKLKEDCISDDEFNTFVELYMGNECTKQAEEFLDELRLESQIKNITIDYSPKLNSCLVMYDRCSSDTMCFAKIKALSYKYQDCNYLGGDDPTRDQIEAYFDYLMTGEPSPGVSDWYIQQIKSKCNISL